MKKAARKKTAAKKKTGARRAPAGKGNLERLERAGLVSAAALNAREKGTVERMSKAEVDVLIRLRKKLGAAGKGRHAAKPDFPL